MKNKLFYYTLIFMTMSIISCNAQKELYNIECISIENQGYVKLKVLDYKNYSKFNVENASKDAVKAILYSGYSSINCQTQKPILKEVADIENFKKIEKKFFSKNGIWKNYIRNSTDSNNSKPEGKKDNDYYIMVNKDGLKKYLEEQKIIKSLNTGF